MTYLGLVAGSEGGVPGKSLGDLAREPNRGSHRPSRRKAALPLPGRWGLTARRGPSKGGPSCHQCGEAASPP
jgi:hypothetical protein